MHIYLPCRKRHPCTHPTLIQHSITRHTPYAIRNGSEQSSAPSRPNASSTLHQPPVNRHRMRPPRLGNVCLEMGAISSWFKHNRRNSKYSASSLPLRPSSCHRQMLDAKFGTPLCRGRARPNQENYGTSGSPRRAPNPCVGNEDENQRFRLFIGRIRERVVDCSFTMACTHALPRETKCRGVNNCNGHDYTDAIIKLVALNSIRDPEIKREILGMTDLRTQDVNDIISLVENKEVARDQTQGAPTVWSAAAISTFKKGRKSAQSGATPAPASD